MSRNSEDQKAHLVGARCHRPYVFAVAGSASQYVTSASKHPNILVYSALTSQDARSKPGKEPCPSLGYALGLLELRNNYNSDRSRIKFYSRYLGAFGATFAAGAVGVPARGAPPPGGGAGGHFAESSLYQLLRPVAVVGETDQGEEHTRRLVARLAHQG